MPIGRFEIRVNSSEQLDVPLMMPVGISPDEWERGGLWSVVGERGRKITLGPIVKAKPNQKQMSSSRKTRRRLCDGLLEELAALNKGGIQVRDSILRSVVVVIEHGTRGIRREQLARLATSKHMLNAYMTQNIGSFPDVIESLISRHEFVKDETSVGGRASLYQQRGVYE